MFLIVQTYKGMTHGVAELMPLTRSRSWSHHGSPVAEFCFDSVEVRPRLASPTSPGLTSPSAAGPVRDRRYAHSRGGGRRVKAARREDQESVRMEVLG